MANEHILKLKAVLDTSEIQTKLAKIQNNQSNSSGNTQTGNFNALANTLNRLNASINNLNNSLKLLSSKGAVASTPLVRQTAGSNLAGSAFETGTALRFQRYNSIQQQRNRQQILNNANHIRTDRNRGRWVSRSSNVLLDIPTLRQQSHPALRQQAALPPRKKGFENPPIADKNNIDISGFKGQFVSAVVGMTLGQMLGKADMYYERKGDLETSKFLKILGPLGERAFTLGSIGSMFGPTGALAAGGIGAVIGGLEGAFDAMAMTAENTANKLEELAQAIETARTAESLKSKSQYLEKLEGGSRVDRELAVSNQEKTIKALEGQIKTVLNGKSLTQLLEEIKATTENEKDLKELTKNPVKHISTGYGTFAVESDSTEDLAKQEDAKKQLADLEKNKKAYDEYKDLEKKLNDAKQLLSDLQALQTNDKQKKLIVDGFFKNEAFTKQLNDLFEKGDINGLTKWANATKSRINQDDADPSEAIKEYNAIQNAINQLEQKNNSELERKKALLEANKKHIDEVLAAEKLEKEINTSTIDQLKEKLKLFKEQKELAIKNSNTEEFDSSTRNISLTNNKIKQLSLESFDKQVDELQTKLSFLKTPDLKNLQSMAAIGANMGENNLDNTAVLTDYLTRITTLQQSIRDILNQKLTTASTYE